MRTQDQLTYLIHSLTASEKKYFKQYIALWGSSKKYEALFDAMLKQAEYDPDELSRRLRKTKKQIADEKNYLQEVLLKALRNYDESATEEVRLTNAYLEVQALHRRGMHAMALRLLDKIYPELMELEMHGLFISAYFTRLELMYKQGYAAQPGIVPRAELDGHMALIREMADYTQLYHDVGPLVMNRSAPEQMQAALQQPLLARPAEEIKSLKARAIYYSIHNALQTIVHGLGGPGLDYAQQIVALYERHAPLRRAQMYTLPYAYLRVALSSTFEQSAISLAALQKALDILEKHPQFFHPRIKAEIESMIQRQRLVILNGIKDYTACEQAGRALYDDKVDGEHYGRVVLIHYLYAHALTMNGKTTEANQVIQQIINSSHGQRADLQMHARIIQLVLQAEFGHYTILPSLIRSTRGWIRKNKLESPATEYILRWITRLSKAPAEERKALLIEMAGDIRADRVPGLRTYYTETFNLLHWIERKLAEKKFKL
ncbi:MAG: hypothetical protein JST83_08740 [Bacteroidetes bacterium]|nr:hypothetical protein [Bacteroidota bacterium]